MRHRLWLPIVGVLMTVAPIANAELYTIAGWQLNRIDLRNQSLIPVGAAVLYDVRCLEYSADGSLYGVDHVTDTLIRIDPQTGTGETVGPLGVDVSLTFIDLTEDSGGQLRMLLEGGLYRIDRTTGAAVLECQGNSPSLRGLAIVDGQMVTSQFQGAPVDAGCGLEYIGANSGTIATGPDGRVYAIRITSVPLDPFFLIYRFDPTSGIWQELANLGQYPGLVGLAISPGQLPAMPVPGLGRGGVSVFILLTAAAALILLRRTS